MIIIHGKHDNNICIVDRTTFEQTISELTDKFRSAVNFYVSHQIEKRKHCLYLILFFKVSSVAGARNKSCRRYKVDTNRSRQVKQIICYV